MSVILAHLLRAMRLAHAIHAAHPDVPAGRVWPAALAIVAEADVNRSLDPALMVALFAPESGFDFRKVNPQSGACGIGQVLYSKDRARQARRCSRVLRSARDGVRAAAAKLDGARETCAGYRWMRRRSYASIDDAREQLERCAVAGYVGGPKATRALSRRRPWIIAMVERRLAMRDQIRAALSLGQRPGGVTRRAGS